VSTQRTHVGRAVAVALAGVVWLAGCGTTHRSEGPSVADSLTASPSPSPAASAAAASAALTAYRGMWSAFVEASKTANPDLPALRIYASGDALRLIVSALVNDQQIGRVAQGDVALAPRATAVTPVGMPTQVTVLDCVDATHWLEYKKSGGLWDNEPGGKHQTTATVTLAGGQWRVSSFLLKDLGTC
jgi:hypothetical protein